MQAGFENLQPFAEKIDAGVGNLQSLPGQMEKLENSITEIKQLLVQGKSKYISN